MAFCKYCGRQLAENEACTCEGARNAAMAQNGAAFVQPAPVVQAPVNIPAVAAQDFTALKTVQAYNADSYSLKGFLKKYLLFVCIGGTVLVAATVLLIILLVGGSGSYLSPINDLVKEINKGTKTDYVSLMSAGMPSEVAKLNQLYYGKIYAEDTEDENEDLQEHFEELSDEIPNWKLEFIPTSENPLSEKELSKYERNYDPENFEYILEDLEDYDVDEFVERYQRKTGADESDLRDYFNSMVKYLKSFKTISISDGYKIKGYYVIKDGSDVVNKTNKANIYVIKFNGNWVAIGSDGSFAFDDYKDGYRESRFLRNYINSYYPSKMLPGM